MVVRRHPAGRRGALHQRHRVVAADPVSRQRDPRVRRPHLGTVGPRFGTDQRAVGAHQPLVVDHAGPVQLRVQSAQLGPELHPERRLVDPVGQRVCVDLDDAAAAGPRPPRGAGLEAVDRRDVVQRAEPARREERRSPFADGPVEPQPPDREVRRRPPRGEPRPPRLVTHPVRRRDQPLQRSLVGREHDAVRLDHRPVLEPDADRRPVVVQPDRGHRHDHPDAQPVEVAAERCPQRRVVVVVGHVEQQSLRRPEEVGVEHGHELAAGEVPRVGEERPREDLEREMPCAVREPELDRAPRPHSARRSPRRFAGTRRRAARGRRRRPRGPGRAG